jgi:hypothetical protein
MGLSLELKSPVWGCLRNAQHRGKDPARLIARLLGISFQAARALVGSEGPLQDDFDDAVDLLRSGPQDAAKAKLQPLTMPSTFHQLLEGLYAVRFIDYLAERRKFHDDAFTLALQYRDLYYALAGPQAWRLVFPVRNEAGDLLGWTGRDIRKHCHIRYLTSENLPTDAVLSFGVPKPLTVICEGPLDALKLDFYGRPMGIAAVATMGTGRADPGKAAGLRRRYPNAIVAFDADATGQALEFAEELGCKSIACPVGYKDPGELTPQDAKIFLQKIAKRACI